MEIAVARRGEEVWCLPKGLVEPGEEITVTAAREVLEETGLEGRLAGPLGEITYWYYSGQDQCRYFKRVFFFLFEAIGGRIEDHGWEVEEVRWFPSREALSRLTYRNERAMLQIALTRLEGEGQDG